MKSSLKIAVAIVIFLVAAIVILESGLLYTPPVAEQREDKTTYTPNRNVVIQATTFNGNIEIQPTTGSLIEVIYSIKTPQGHLYDIKTATNETKNENTTTLVTSAQNQASILGAYASLLIKLPATSQYNLTLLTANGDIVKPQLNDVKVAVSTSNGNIDIKDSNCSLIEAVSMNGDIKVGLAQGTLFHVAASVGNGNIAYQGIAMNTTTLSATRLKGATSAGEGNLSLSLMSANGNITIEYLP